MNSSPARRSRPDQFRFCRVGGNARNENAPNAYYAQDGYDFMSPPHPQRRKETYLPISPTESFSIRANGEVIVSSKCFSIVRFRQFEAPVIRRSLRLRFVQWAAAGICLLAALCGLLQISRHLAELEAKTSSRTDLVDHLGSTTHDLDTRITPIYAEMKVAKESLGLLANGTKSEVVPLSDAESLKRLAKTLDRLERFLTKARSVPTEDEGPAAPASRQPLLGDSVDKASVVVVNNGYNFDASIPLIAGAAVHRKLTGEPDYWLLEARQMQGVTPARVIPFATMENGVAVHDLDDGHDYIITAQGQWIKYG